MDEKQLEKLNKMRELLDDGKASSEEVAKMFASFLGIINTVKDTLEKNLAQNKGELSDTINEVYSLLKGHEKDITKTIKDLEQKVTVDNKAVRTQLLDKINEVKDLIPEIPSLKPLEDKLTDLEKKIPTLPNLKPFEDKISELEKKIPVLDNKRLDDIERIAKANAMPITTSFVNGVRAKNIDFTGATVTHQGDTARVTITGGTGAVDSVNGQTGVVVLDADDIDDTSTTHKFVTAGDLTKLSNLSGTNTGDQTITLSGDVTGSGATSIATTIANGAVDIGMLSATGTPSGSTFLRGDNTWATPAGSGDVSKVGTPADNQVGVWTGDGTIEGTSALTFNNGLNITAERSGGVMTITRTPSSATDAVYGTQVIKAKHDVDMGDGFGVGQTYAIEDNAGVENIIASVQAVRDGADNTGALKLVTHAAGTPVINQVLTSDGAAAFAKSIFITEGTAMSEQSGLGQIFVKSADSKLYFRDDGGNEFDLTASGSGITRSIVTTTGNLTLGSTASTDYVYFVAGAHAITMPTAVSNTNRYTVKNTHSANITISCTGVETIEGASTAVIAPNESVDIISNNTNWLII